MKKTERNIAATFARNLKFFRQKCNYSQEKLAELIDVSPATISNYETEYSNPNFDTIQKFINVCNFEIQFVDKENKKVYTIEELSKEMDF